ncbi:hypothetical protein ACQKNX_08380 [Lysinibacillus sp. NPDC093712]|uniref:hypothetical protein n=1 Tax=Lysinibacillus sp. NPDC093712 TaxID=3390579 RepID=UPI003CFF72B7
MVMNNITSVRSTIKALTISFNYFEYQNEIAKFFFKNLKQYVYDYNPKFNPDYAFEVDLSELKGVNLKKFKDKELIRKHITRAHFMENVGYSEKTYKAFYCGDSMKLEVVGDILKVADTDIHEYLRYLVDQDNDLVCTNIEALESILYTYSSRIKTSKEDKFQHVIFKDLIYCACGQKSYRKINRTCPITYECKTRRNQYNLKKCKFKSPQEQLLIDAVFEQKGVKITSRNEAFKLIEKIVYRSKNDFDIYYK